MKVCLRCKDELDESEFGVSANRPDGLTPCCRSCTNKRARTKYKPAYGGAVTGQTARARTTRQQMIAQYGLEMTEVMETLPPATRNDFHRF